MELLVPGHLEALSAGGKKSGAAGTNSPALSSKGEEHMASTGTRMSHRRDTILTKTLS